MTHYFDSSALVKLVHAEPESTALERFIGDHPNETPTSSELVRTEVVRAVAADGPAAIADAQLMLARITQVAVTADLLDAAAELPTEPLLRSLDAIHLASARSVPELRAVITYDHRMRSAAEALGLPVVSPG